MQTFSSLIRAPWRMVLLLAVAGSLVLTGCNSVDPSTYSTVKLPPAMIYPAKPPKPTVVLGERIELRSMDSTTSAVAPAAPNRDLPLPPSYVSHEPGQTLGRDEILAELRSSGVRTRFNVTDNRYVVPSHTWMNEEYQPFFDWYLRYLDTDYHAEGMDCDNYSNFYKQNLVLANLRSGGSRHGDVPCAVMIVNQHDKGIIHALNLIRTDRGWFAVEPQEGRIVSLRNYRYLNYIQYVDM
ncbi:MAG: hypothetical protein ACFBZ8_02130 [Opitutales bacterium]